MNINLSDMIAILSITITVNIALFAVFYASIFKRAQKLTKHEKEITQNKMILIKTMDQQTLCLEQLYVKICDVENMVERFASKMGENNRKLILKCREITHPKNYLLLKNISELKIFGEDEEFRLSAFKKLVSTGDVKTLDLIELKIETENNSYNKELYKSYKKRLRNHINATLNHN